MFNFWKFGRKAVGPVRVVGPGGGLPARRIYHLVDEGRPTMPSIGRINTLVGNDVTQIRGLKSARLGVGQLNSVRRQLARQTGTNFAAWMGVGAARKRNNPALWLPGGAALPLTPKADRFWANLQPTIRYWKKR